jgi:hypothetical protein
LWLEFQSFFLENALDFPLQNIVHAIEIACTHAMSRKINVTIHDMNNDAVILQTVSKAPLDAGFGHLHARACLFAKWHGRGAPREARQTAFLPPVSHSRAHPWSSGYSIAPLPQRTEPRPDSKTRFAELRRRAGTPSPAHAPVRGRTYFRWGENCMAAPP